MSILCNIHELYTICNYSFILNKSFDSFIPFRGVMTIICGDCLDVMKNMGDNSISCIVTDPPYGLSFMGKEWDHQVPGIEYWQECLRIVKPGGYLLAMGGTRTYHRLTCAIEDAGWEIRDCLMWIYGSGFPKSHNHFGIEGYGTALKPAHEPIIMAMKLCEGTFKQNAEKWGQAGINIDGCRIEGNWDRCSTTRDDIRSGNFIKDSPQKIECDPQSCHPKGRWPANVLFDEEAAALLDEQSGVSRTSSGMKKPNHPTLEIYGKYNPQPNLISGYSDFGGASRFFYCAKASSGERNEGLEGLPQINKPLMGEFKDNPGRDTPKSSPTPRQNHHPTVKPLKLMEYLIRLVMPPKEGILLDPFAGSGTTILAAKNLGFAGIGIEKSEEYCEIARARIDNMDKIKENTQLEFEY